MDDHPDYDLNPQATYERVLRLAEIDAYEREATRQNIEFSKLPDWRQAVLEGDRLNDGSHEQEYEEDRTGE